MIGWHLPTRMRHPSLAPPGRAARLLRGGSRHVIAHGIVVIVMLLLLLLLGWGLRRGAARRRPPCRLWIKSPIAFRPLVCADRWGKLGGRGSGITGRRWRGPRTLIALRRMRGHARIGRTNVRRIYPWTPCRLSGGGGHVRGLHCRSRLRSGREQEGDRKRAGNRQRRDIRS